MEKKKMKKRLVFDGGKERGFRKRRGITDTGGGEEDGLAKEDDGISFHS